MDKVAAEYAASVREWYGWHFPELYKLVPDGVCYARCVLAIGFRADAATADLTDILTEEVAATVKEAALYSMGSDITAADLQQIQECCTKLIAHVQEYHPTD